MEVDFSLTLLPKNQKQQSSELSPLENKSVGSKTSEMYIDESQDHSKNYQC